MTTRAIKLASRRREKREAESLERGVIEALAHASSRFLDRYSADGRAEAMVFCCLALLRMAGLDTDNSVKDKAEAIVRAHQIARLDNLGSVPTKRRE